MTVVFSFVNIIIDVEAGTEARKFSQLYSAGYGRASVSQYKYGNGWISITALANTEHITASRETVLYLEIVIFLNSEVSGLDRSLPYSYSGLILIWWSVDSMTAYG